MPVIDELKIVPTPVDLRMWIHEVTMGWRTVAEAQAILDAAPESLTNKRIIALSLVPGLVREVLLGLEDKRYTKVALVTRFGDVVMALHTAVKDAGVECENLFPGTPDLKRKKRMMQFLTHPRHPILALQLLTPFELRTDRMLDVFFVGNQHPEATIACVEENARVWYVTEK